MEEIKTEEKNSVGMIMSYATGKFLAEFLTGAYGIMVFFFFEKEMHLNPWYVTIATIIYAIWNAVNDPLIGYLTNKKAPMSKIFGRRFPWIVIGLTFCLLSFCLIFALPKSWANTINTRAIFIWMVIFVCLYDAFYTLWEVNYQSLYPDKFRNEKERIRVSGISTAIGVLGIVAGFLIPPMVYEYGNPASFAKAAVIILVIGVIVSILGIPGLKENDKMIERFKLKQNFEEKHPEEKVSFVKSMKINLKNKNLLGLLLSMFFYQSGCMCMTSSVNYVVSGVLNKPSSASTPIMAAMLVGALLSILIWTRLSKKITNNINMLVVTCFIMAIFCLPMTFMRTTLGYIIFMGLWGLGFGGFWTFSIPGMADIVDDLVVQQKKRNDGIVMGLRAFFMRLSYAVQAITFALCHQLTGFNPENGAIQTAKAKMGISLHFAFFPAIYFILSALCLIIICNLSNEKIEYNHKELKALNL
ncbi:MAG: MFS transporter [Sphaerochaetaceae bacterium]